MNILEKDKFLPQSTISRDFQSQEYKFAIPKYLTWLAEKPEEKAKKNIGYCKYTFHVSRKRHKYRP